MKKWFLMLMMMVSIPAFAVVNVDTNGLTDSQKAALVQQVEEMKAKAESPETMVAAVDKWVNVGERFGKMMGGAAKEVGMAANEFLLTPVGMLTAGIIAFNYIGGPIIHVGVGLMILFLGLSVMFWLQTKATQFHVEYDLSKPKFFGGFHVKSKKRAEIDGDTLAGILIGYGVVFALSLWTIFAW